GCDAGGTHSLFGHAMTKNRQSFEVLKTYRIPHPGSSDCCKNTSIQWMRNRKEDIPGTFTSVKHQTTSFHLVQTVATFLCISISDGTLEIHYLHPSDGSHQPDILLPSQYSLRSQFRQGVGAGRAPVSFPGIVNTLSEKPNSYQAAYGAMRGS